MSKQSRKSKRQMMNRIKTAYNDSKVVIEVDKERLKVK